MPDAELHQYERDAEYARAKLAHNLSRLKRPAAVSEAAQHFMDKASEKAQSTASNFVDELKAKAAANPIAALAIGAGIGWRLIRNPPIATALIGAGLFSLLRTPTPEAAAHESFDPVATGVATLKAQVNDAAASVYARAEYLGDAVMTRASDAAAAVGGRLQAAAQGAQTTGQALVDSAGAHVTSISAAAVENVAAARRSLGETAGAVNDALSSAYRASTSQASDAVRGVAAVARTAVAEQTDMLVMRARETNGSAQDRLLLGIAGTAIALALGFAWQAQSAQRED